LIVVLANSDLADKLGVAVLLSIPFQVSDFGSPGRQFRFLPGAGLRCNLRFSLFAINSVFNDPAATSSLPSRLCRRLRTFGAPKSASQDMDQRQDRSVRSRGNFPQPETGNRGIDSTIGKRSAIAMG
jgi:hypothetical protein